MEKFYFIRYPDNMIEYSENIPSSCNLNIIKQRHRIFLTEKEAIEWQKPLDIPELKEQIYFNKEFSKDIELQKLYGYSK